MAGYFLFAARLTLLRIDAFRDSVCCHASVRTFERHYSTMALYKSRIVADLCFRLTKIALFIFALPFSFNIVGIYIARLHGFSSYFELTLTLVAYTGLVFLAAYHVRQTIKRVMARVHIRELRTSKSGKVELPVLLYLRSFGDD
jgi:hypothetical protein